MTHPAGTWRPAVQATARCLTGCAIGEILGMMIGTRARPARRRHRRTLRRARVALRLRADHAPAARPAPRPACRAEHRAGRRTISIAAVETIDNAVMLLVPGAMDAGPLTVVFWASLAFALAVAFVLTVPINRWLIFRGRGHAVVPHHH
ncbi:DUF4396 domain-containing protein [Catenuloplanes indicus]